MQVSTLYRERTYFSDFSDIGTELLRLAEEVHEGNQSAGWWTDLKTGASILETRNRPEVLKLITSELSEAAEGAELGLMDDKLPHLPMFNVEIADAVIRLLDIIGAEGRVHGRDLDKESAAILNLAIKMSRGDLMCETTNGMLMLVVRRLSMAMEHHRKGRCDDYRVCLWHAVGQLFAISDIHRIPLFDVIAQKRAFNAARADHKPENRKAADGKAY